MSAVAAAKILRLVFKPNIGAKNGEKFSQSGWAAGAKKAKKRP